MCNYNLIVNLIYRKIHNPEKYIIPQGGTHGRDAGSPERDDKGRGGPLQGRGPAGSDL